MSEQMRPEVPESKSRLEILAETLSALEEEYAVLAVDRTLLMTASEYQKMMELKKRIPSLDSYEGSELSEEVVLAQLFLLDVVNSSLEDMETYFSSHNGKWDETIS